MLMMRPCRRSTMVRATARAQSAGPRRLTASTSSQSSGVRSTTVFSVPEMPALLTRTSIRPKAWMTAAVSASMSRASPISAWKTSARTPAPPASRHVDHGDHLADGIYRFRLAEDLRDGAGGWRLDLHLGLLRLEDEQNLPGGDRFADPFPPFDDGCFGHREAKLRHLDVDPHQPRTSRTARAIRSASGSQNFSIGGLKGTGVNGGVTRRIGALSERKPCSAARAATSAPNPQGPHAS